MEITTADKINGALMVFTEPKFYFSVGAAMIFLACVGRAKHTARGIPTKLGRLGLVLHWASLSLAVVLLAIAGAILAETPKAHGLTSVEAGILAAAAAIVWLIGKSLRYILTGPSGAPAPPVTPMSTLRSTSVRTAGIGANTRPAELA